MSRTSGKKSGEISVVGIVVKAVLLAAMIWGLYFVGSAVIENVKYKSDRLVDEAGHLNWLEEDYLDKNYGEIYERLSRYELTSEEFAVYWEISKAAIALEDFKQWHRAETKGLDGSTEKKEYYYNEILSYAKKCKFERNRAELERFAAEATEIREQSAGVE